MYGITAPQLSHPLTSFASPSLFSLCLTGIVTLPLPTMNPPCQVPARLYANKSNYVDNVGVDDDDEEEDGDDNDMIMVMMMTIINMMMMIACIDRRCTLNVTTSSACSQAHQQMDSIPM